MNRRLEMLEKLAGSGQADSFALYALALEYKKCERFDEAIQRFEQLREKDPDYLPMYLMAGQLLIDQGALEQAKFWLNQGILLAERQGQAKTLSELEDALQSAG